MGSTIIVPVEGSKYGYKTLPFRYENPIASILSDRYDEVLIVAVAIVEFI